MRQSTLFTHTTKEAPKDEISLNAELLVRGGFVDKLMAGVYTYLPLGLRVMKKIQNIIREEMDAIDGQEVLMPSLTPRDIWQTTGRWDTIDVMFKIQSQHDKQYALGSTHEEVVTPLVQKFVHSYKDLPKSVYQIQTKFRDELRSKSGILRGREFTMKDMYSFHRTSADFSEYYKRCMQAYTNVFTRCGLDAKIAEASGGMFSKEPSHEYQVFTENGEDIIYGCADCNIYKNKEVVDETNPICPKCNKTMTTNKAIEVGNIFTLNTGYTAPFSFTYSDETGTQQPVYMGCYGIGVSRVMGAVVEVHHDEKGIKWPENLTPFQVHLISLCREDASKEKANSLYENLQKQGIEVLFDDRDARAGEKFADSDLIGIPTRIVISEKTLAENSVEVKKRTETNSKLVPITKINEEL
jgi:prolyl-tRNA synthetase